MPNNLNDCHHCCDMLRMLLVRQKGTDYSPNVSCGMFTGRVLQLHKSARRSFTNPRVALARRNLVLEGLWTFAYPIRS